MTNLIADPITALDLNMPLVEEYANASRSPATRRAYAHDWQDFITWCEAHAVDHLPAAPATAAAYIADLAKQRRTVSTITRRLTAISQAHQLAGHPTPTRDERVRTVLKGIKRKLGTAQQGKAPATIEVVRILLQQLGRPPPRLAPRKPRSGADPPGVCWRVPPFGAGEFQHRRCGH